MSSLKYLFLFAVGFGVMATLVRPRIPWPTEYGLQAKWEYFSRNHEQYDAVFLGTSRVFRGIDTPLFDEELAKHGVELSTFNFGVAGMRAFEQDFVLQQLLDLDSERLRYVFIEGGPWSPRFKHPALTFSSRSVFWHTPAQTQKVLDSALRLDGPWSERLRLAATHFELFLRKLSSYGQGRTLAKEVFRDGPEEEKYERTLAFLGRQKGYQSADQHTGRSLMQGREDLLEDSSAFEAQVARIEAESADLPPPESVSRIGVRSQHELAREKGVELIYVIQPAYEGAAERLLLHQEGEIERLLDFNRPSRYPELFELVNRYDEKHFNQRGAEIFTRILAREVAEEISGDTQ